MRNIMILAVALSLAGCDDTEKKAAEAKAAAEAAAAKAAEEAAKAKAEAEKAAAEAKAKAMEAFTSSKNELVKKVGDFMTEADAKATELKDRVKKLPKAAKAKAEPALAAFDTAKETLASAKGELEALADPDKWAEVGPKVTTALEAAQKSLADAEAAFPVAKKKK